MQRNGRLIEIGKGCFKIIPRPRGGDWLEADLQQLKRGGFTFVVSLLTEPEVLELDLVREESLCKALQLEFYSYPIIDRTTPSNRTTFEDFAAQIFKNLDQGGRGFFHCRAGLGRAPLLGCTVMVQAGAQADLAWQMLAESRGQEVPDTDAQRKWVRAPQDSVLDLDNALSKLMGTDPKAKEQN